MTEAEKQEIVGLVMTQISSQAVDFDIATEQPQANDLLTAVRENESGGYKGVTIKWDDVARIATEVANRAAERAEQAETDANNILEQVQSKGTEITNFVATSKTEIETQKDESVNAVKSVYQTDLDELKGDLEVENNALKVEVARNRRQIENLNDRLDGDLIENKYKMTGETPDDAGVLLLPSSKLLPFAEIDEVHGRTEAYSELDLGSRNDWIYGNYIASAWAISLDAKAILSAENYTLQTWGNIDVGAFAYEPIAKVLAVNTGSSTVKPSGMLRYDGTSNTLHNAENVQVKSVGRNIFDEKVVETGYLVNGKINTGYGTLWASESYIKVEPSTTYYIGITYSIPNYGIIISWYDSNKTHISTSYYYTITITSPVGAEYMRFNVNSNYGSQSYKGDCVVQLASITDRTYIPYSHGIISIPSDWYTKAEALGYDLGMEGCTIDMVGKKVTWGKRIEGLGIVDITPFIKTFAELGFEPIDNGLPVESNGTISVVSDGATAEALIHYAIDNRSTT